MNDTHSVARLSLLASAIARCNLRVLPGKPGEPAWTDGRVVFVDADAGPSEQVLAATVQASLLAAGSFDRDILRRLLRRPGLARRYLAIEGRRALEAIEQLLPAAARALLASHNGLISHSPAASLLAARSRAPITTPPDSFGRISARHLLEVLRREDVSQHIPHKPHAPVELALAEETEHAQDNISSPVGGGGAIGKWLAKLLAAARQITGGGSPGAEAPTHVTSMGTRSRPRALHSMAAPKHIETTGIKDRARGTTYPEWDLHARRYHENFCSVREVEVKPKPGAQAIALPDRVGLRRALARLGLGIDRYHRQMQGDDIDIDAAIEARVELLAGSAPDEAVFVDSVRRRRDLSVLLLLDISGSAAEPGHAGKTVHALQRAAAAALMRALHELGDRVALYAYHSQGRHAVSVMPVKRFAEGPNVLQRLASLEPGAYSRLGAAIRHGTSRLKADGCTPRQLLVVLSDGLAYDHGYEPAYGAADARRALAEARSQGVGCLCLSIGAATEHQSLRRVFGSSAYAALSAPDQLCHVVGPLFRAAIRSADVRRIVS